MPKWVGLRMHRSLPNGIDQTAFHCNRISIKLDSPTWAPLISAARVAISVKLQDRKCRPYVRIYKEFSIIPLASDDWVHDVAAPDDRSPRSRGFLV
jgi:hypothetical protein